MKKITTTLILALMLVGLVVGVAQAAELEDNSVNATSGRLMYGQVTAITIDSFTLETARGGEFTYLIDDDTRFRSPEVEHPTFADLVVGGKVAVAARLVDGDLLAKVVVLLPDDFNPGNRFGIRARGTIGDLDLEAGTFTLVKPSGEEMTFTVGDRTRFLGQSSSLEDLEPGWRVGVAASEQEDGSYLATVVVAVAKKTRRVEAAGTVTNISDDGFTLTTRQGEERSFLVDENTRFRSRGGTVQSLEDLQLDMVALVVAQPQEDGSYLALQVIAGSKDDLPKFEVKMGGKVILVGVDSFTIQTRSGEQVTFKVAAETRFLSRGVQVENFLDLKPGMIVLVGAEDLGDGEFLARLVIAARPRGR